MSEVIENKEVETVKEEVVAKPTGSKTEVVTKQDDTQPKSKDEARGDKKPGQRKFNNRRRPNSKFKRDTEFEEKVVNVARVTTVVKGGRRFSFSTLVVVGNKKGKVGYGHGKANEVPNAIKKAIKDAKNNMITVPIIDRRTVPHEQVGRFLASKVLVKSAPKGKGIIASGAVRSVVELAGYKDIYTKSLGSRSKTNSVKATLEALKGLRTVESIAKLRDISVEKVIGG